MIELLKSMIKGHVTIKDKRSGEILVDKDNAIHYGNISTAIAKALVGNSNSFITYMAFGDGGVIIEQSGKITYRSPNISETKNPKEELYNTNLVVRMANESDTTARDVTVPGGNTQNFEDIVCVVNLAPGFPASQNAYDNPNRYEANKDDDTYEQNIQKFIFNEIALYTGPKTVDLDFSSDTASEQSITSFLDNENTILITHIIFHPVQKTANRELEITYTLRIQMG